MSVRDLVFEPPRSGPTLWEIGVPDRTAAEFYVPDPDPTYINRLFVNKDRLSISLTITRSMRIWEAMDQCALLTD
jgi:hypothetical protein